MSRISVIIPAHNEENSIGLVLDALPQKKIHEINISLKGDNFNTVLINGSDYTAECKNLYSKSINKYISKIIFFAI